MTEPEGHLRLTLGLENGDTEVGKCVTRRPVPRAWRATGILPVLEQGHDGHGTRKWHGRPHP